MNKKPKIQYTLSKNPFSVNEGKEDIKMDKNIDDDTLPSKKEYTTKQIKRILHNQQIILDMTRPHLENKDLELIYSCANDSMCRLEGILHYPDMEED